MVVATAAAAHADGDAVANAATSPGATAVGFSATVAFQGAAAVALVAAAVAFAAVAIWWRRSERGGCDPTWMGC